MGLSTCIHFVESIKQIKIKTDFVHNTIIVIVSLRPTTTVYNRESRSEHLYNGNVHELCLMCIVIDMYTVDRYKSLKQYDFGSTVYFCLNVIIIIFPRRTITTKDVDCRNEFMKRVRYTLRYTSVIYVNSNNNNSNNNIFF